MTLKSIIPKIIYISVFKILNLKFMKIMVSHLPVMMIATPHLICKKIKIKQDIKNNKCMILKLK